jgi:hypothetical protein
MVWFVGCACAALAGLFLWLANRPLTPAQRRSRGDKFASDHLLYVDLADVPAFDALLDQQRRHRYVFVAVLSLVIGATSIVILLTSVDDSLLLPMVITEVITGRCLVAALEVLGTPESPGPPRPDDFVPPLLRTGYAALAVLGVVVASWAALAPSPYADASTVAMALVATVPFLAMESVSRVVARPLTEGPSGRRYTQQAVRSDTLNQLYAGEWSLSLLVLGNALMDQDAYELLTTLLGGFVVISLGGLVLQKRLGPNRLRFRRRLWPQLAPDEIVTTSAP